MGYTLREGNYRNLGVQVENTSVVFTFEGEKEDICAILLYGKNHEVTERILAPEEYCMGSIRSVRVEGMTAKNLMYNYEINGDVITDVYAHKIIGREKWNDNARERVNYRICGGYEPETFDWTGDRPPEVPRHEMFLYKLHVRGFSMDAGLRGKSRGTFAAIIDKIPYLKKLGVTSVELMPVYEFEELVIEKAPALPDYLKWKSEAGDMILPPKELEISKINYWGYTAGNYFAVKASYSSTPNATQEFKELVRKLHQNGIECIMEMYFEDGMNQNVILDVLRYWVREYHIDGFHLLGNSVPITAVAQDMLLSRTKIFANAFDNALLEQKRKYPHLFLYNDEYMYPIRMMLNYLGGDIGQFLCQQRKQHPVMGFVNFIAGNNGFTLYDLFAYQEKHNEANGEDNLDGNAWNFSGNCGYEGRTGRHMVNELRCRQLCNAIAVLMMGQGVPLLLAGDEFGNSQEGNNNAYCQDNRIGWLNWKKGERFAWFTETVRKMAVFRREHPILSLEIPMEQKDYKRVGFPDLSYHGKNAWVSSYAVGVTKPAIGIMYCGDYAKRDDGSTDDFIYIGYNFHNGHERLALPELSKKKKWYLVFDTARDKDPFLEEPEKVIEQHVRMKPQSVKILIGK